MQSGSWLGIARNIAYRTEAAILIATSTLLVLVGLSGWRAIEQLQTFSDVSAQTQSYSQIVLGLEAVMADIVKAESAVLAYVLIVDASFLSAYDGALVDIGHRFERLRNLTASAPSLSAEIEYLRKLIQQRQNQLGDLINYHRTGHEKQALDLVAGSRLVTDAMTQGLEPLKSKYQDVLASTHIKAERLRSDVITSFLITSGFGTAIIVLMSLVAVAEARAVRRLTRQLRHESRHDALTGLPNRAYLREWLLRSIASATRSNSMLALLFIDLNDFKKVNDTFGHKEGDTVLIEAAHKFTATARATDFLARLGGDEFALIIGDLKDISGVETAAAQYAALSIVRGTCVVTASVGYAVFPDDSSNADDLIAMSDEAMYKNKRIAKSMASTA